MISLTALEARRGSLIEEISTAEALRQSAVRAKFSAQQKLDFGGAQLTPARRTQLQAQISQAQAQINEQTQIINTLEQQLIAVESDISQARIAQGPQASAGQQVKQAQTARDDGASPTNPPPPPTQVAEDGRVVAAQDRPASNAQRPEPGAVDAGTNAPVRKAANTQSTPPITAQPGGAQPSTGSPSPSPTATQNPGATASGDDNPGGTGVRARLNNLFGGINNRIVPEPNVLDQYASYTYNISVYLMNPNEYSKMIQSKKKTIAGSQLLFMSGGAGPAGSLVPNDQITAEDPVLAAQERVANLGRNEFFSFDYYIDDVQISSLLSGYGTGGPTNATELKFKVIEPNSMTFLPNLYRACQQYIRAGASDVNKNYSAQIYLMVIRFYGYDDQGNLVQANRSGQDAAGSDVNAVVEKFIPFLLTGIKFRIANKVVEYDCQAKVIPDVVNLHPARGTIPYNVELQSQTVRDLLVGQQKFAGNDAEGRVAPTVTQTAAAARTPTNAASSGWATANANAKSFAARQAAAAAKINAARREQLGLGPNPSPPPGPDNVVAVTEASTSNAAPAKANAIRNPTLITGLVDALNQYQENISGPEDGKPQLYPDKYEIIIVDDEIASAQVIPPGETNLKQVPMTQAETANQQKNPATQKVDNNAKTSKIISGTSIVQFLDQIIRTSSYITEQQTAIYNAAQQKLLPNGTPAQAVGWYRIGLQATPQLDKFDEKRGDYAYNITYQINIFAVSNVKSDFFPSPQFRGVQKQYKYWFTGENTQILDFSQDFNYLYYIVSNGPRLPITSNYREVEKRYYTVRSPESSQGQDTDVVNEASANAADYLYSPGNQGRLKMKIVGDPAWVFQGELWSGVQGLQFNYGPFLPDGTINIEGQESMFEVTWNLPVDYDLSTGIADPTIKNFNRSASAAGDPAETYIYKAIKCVSVFGRGKFEQELEGALQIYPLEDQTATKRSSTSATVSDAFARGPDQFDAETRRLQAASNQARFAGKTWNDRQQSASVTMRSAYAEAANRLTSPAGYGPPQPPSSGGQQVGAASEPSSLFGQYGATGPGTGSPVVTYTTQTGRVITASSDQDIKDAFNAGYINKITQNSLTRQLNSLQQQANSPKTSAPPQIGAKEY